MAYDLKQVGGYGTGSLGDVTNPTGQICSYANVTAITTNTITIGAPSNGAYEKFVAGTEILLHVSATNGTSKEYAYLGRYMVCRIITVSGSVLTLDKDLTQLILASSLNLYIVQAITIPQFTSLTVTTGNISPIAFNITNKYGGLLPIKTNTGLNLNGGNISLVDKGIPVANAAYRPNTPLDAIALSADWAGHENHSNGRVFLNCGDGAVMFWGKKLINSKGTASRIGGTAAGKPYMRGADIVTNAASIGGSTIHLVAGEIEGFEYDMISKQKGTGQGIGRCYIASNTILRMDEGLYAYDCISNPAKLREMNITGFGDGSLGDVVNPTARLNTCAKVISISSNRKIVSYSDKIFVGMAPLAAGALIMVHLPKGKTADDYAKWGRFEIAKVLSDDGSSLILEKPLNIIANADLENYYCQIVSVAQFNNLTINTSYRYSLSWYEDCGGVCAIAVKNKCDIRSGMINVEVKGGGVSYDFRAWNYIGNTHMQDRLPVGGRHGSVFLLAQNVDMNTASRIGATYSGANFHGIGGNGGSNGGYGGYGGYGGSGYGCGGDGGTSEENTKGYGGKGGNGGYGGCGGRGGNGGDFSFKHYSGRGGNGGDGNYGGLGSSGGQGSSNNEGVLACGGNGGNGSCGGWGGSGGRGTSINGTSARGRDGGYGIYGVRGANGDGGTDIVLSTPAIGVIGSINQNDVADRTDHYGGAHIFAVIDTCNGFNMATFSTGGNGNCANGWQFIYCNEVTNENMTGAAI